jgi:hypothetical protein
VSFFIIVHSWAMGILLFHLFGEVEVTHGDHRLNMKLVLQSLLGLHVHSCIISWVETPKTPSSAFGSYTRALLVSQDGRHLFVTPWKWPSRYSLYHKEFQILGRRQVCEVHYIEKPEVEESIQWFYNLWLFFFNSIFQSSCLEIWVDFDFEPKLDSKLN